MDGYSITKWSSLHSNLQTNFVSLTPPLVMLLDGQKCKYSMLLIPTVLFYEIEWTLQPLGAASGALGFYSRSIRSQFPVKSHGDTRQGTLY